ncbi:hypothetical protein C5748_00780 [Phyllobacterium phragmitis]|uniref:Uncharacterized protein n=1 Tax=Phyllobacterium phragmitis TaxID=2670329 RepID=A0A2S9IZ05_9HYPH|nr:hypothetical protein [Phyllobacterium phragmitis]PRD45730.1 hypothetical protein C5748_00780 [Phyllobacterium phragmitis]
MKPRYERIFEPTDTWAIFDSVTGIPVIIGTKLMIGLTLEEAEEALAALNAPPKSRKSSAA